MGPQRIKGNMKTKVTTDEMKKLEEMRQNFENAKQIGNCVLREIYRVLCHWFQIYSFENEDSFWLLLQHVI